MPKPTLQQRNLIQDAVLAPQAGDAAQLPDSTLRDELALTSSLVFPLGRGARGKSLWLRWAIERALNAGRQLTIVDADRTNPTLAAYFPNVIRPDSAEDDDLERLIRDLTERLMEQPGAAVIDLGGGDLVLKRLARKHRGLVRYLEACSIRGVAAYVFGPDRDDLAYLRDLEEGGLFAPQATILVLNEALVPPNSSTLRLFEPLMNDPIFLRATERGAIPVFMPRLDPARELDNRRLGFFAAEAGQMGQGHTRIGPWNRSLIRVWREIMEENHRPVARRLP